MTTFLGGKPVTSVLTELPPRPAPKRTRESLQILVALRDLAEDQAEVERLRAYADHWAQRRLELEAESKAALARIDDIRASYQAFEWRIDFAGYEQP